MGGWLPEILSFSDAFRFKRLMINDHRPLRAGTDLRILSGNSGGYHAARP